MPGVIDRPVPPASTAGSTATTGSATPPSGNIALVNGNTIAQNIPGAAASSSSSSSSSSADPIPTAGAPQALSPAEAARARHIQVRNRRLRYLTAHSSTYFTSPDLELASPLLYDTLIRQFQSPSEREAEGVRKGWSGILMADLERSEAKLAALQNPSSRTDVLLEVGGTDDEPVTNKEEGLQRWKDAMTRRFLGGGDEEVDYKTIDDNEEWDDAVEKERDLQDAYFDAESPCLVEGGRSTDTGELDY